MYMTDQDQSTPNGELETSLGVNFTNNFINKGLEVTFKRSTSVNKATQVLKREITFLNAKNVRDSNNIPSGGIIRNVEMGLVEIDILTKRLTEIINNFEDFTDVTISAISENNNIIQKSKIPRNSGVAVNVDGCYKTIILIMH